MILFSMIDYNTPKVKMTVQFAIKYAWVSFRLINQHSYTYNNLVIRTQRPVEA